MIHYMDIQNLEPINYLSDFTFLSHIKNTIAYLVVKTGLVMYCQFDVSSVNFSDLILSYKVAKSDDNMIKCHCSRI